MHLLIPLIFSSLIQGHCLHASKKEICESFGPAMERDRNENRPNCEIAPDQTCKSFVEKNIDITLNGTPFINHEECKSIIFGKVFNCFDGKYFEDTAYSRFRATWNDEQLRHLPCADRKNTTGCPALTPADPLYEKHVLEQRQQEKEKEKDQGKEKEKDQGKEKEKEQVKEKEKEKGKEGNNAMQQPKINFALIAIFILYWAY